MSTEHLMHLRPFTRLTEILSKVWPIEMGTETQKKEVCSGAVPVSKKSFIEEKNGWNQEREKFLKRKRLAYNQDWYKV